MIINDIHYTLIHTTAQPKKQLIHRSVMAILKSIRIYRNQCRIWGKSNDISIHMKVLKMSAQGILDEKYDSIISLHSTPPSIQYSACTYFIHPERKRGEDDLGQI